VSSLEQLDLGGGSADEKDELGDSILLGELQGGGAALVGQVKDCHVWNTGISSTTTGGKGEKVQTRLAWVNEAAADLDPLTLVNGAVFGNGGVSPMSSTLDCRGGLWTIDLPKKINPYLVAVFDRANKQSQVAKNICLFTEFDPDEIHSGRCIAGVVENDQFWRLIPIPREVKQAGLTQLGVQVYTSLETPVGLSEVEIYE
jgi:hypothetical protein